MKNSVPQPLKRWPTSRLVNLAGGAVAENIDNQIVCLRPLIEYGAYLKFEIPSYNSLFPALHELGLISITVENIWNRYQLDGRMPIEVNACFSTNRNPLLLEEQSQKWSQVSSHAGEKKNAEIWDGASRISHQLRTVQNELNAIARTYRDQLTARLVSKDYKDGKLFADMFSGYCYQAVQNYLINACILRDYLAEFYCKFCLPDGVSTESKVTTMASLAKHVLRVCNHEDPLFQLLKVQTLTGGWINELGHYRDLAAHSVPLAIAMRRTFVRCSSTYILSKYEVPGVYCSLPSNPGEIRTERAKGETFADFERMWQGVLDKASGEDQGPDGLRYAHGTARHLAELAESVLRRSPVTPKEVVITDSMVVGEIKVSRGDERT